MSIPTKIYYNWQQVEVDTFDLYQQIQKSGETIDLVVGVTRGGLVPGVILSHLLNVPFIPITVQLRDGLTIDVDASDIDAVTFSSLNENILIVDDICDSGATFDLLKKNIEKSGDIECVKFASLWYNEGCLFNVHYTARHKNSKLENSWIVFPWESLFNGAR